MFCKICRDTDYIEAPDNNSWKLYFAKIGRSYQRVLVPCHACGGLEGRNNRLALAARLETRKRAGTFKPTGCNS